VTLQVTNTGPREGAEVVQLYAARPGSALFRPAKELKGFSKVFLKPGETKTVVIPFDERTFRYFNTATNRFEVEGGRYEVLLGASSADIRLRGALTVAGTEAPVPGDAAALPSYYQPTAAGIHAVGDREFAALLGRAPPPRLWDRTAPLGREDALAQLVYAKGGLARTVATGMVKAKDQAAARGQPNMNLLYTCNMPVRAIAKMSGGAVNMPMVDGILKIANGRFLAGLGTVLVEAVKLFKARHATLFEFIMFNLLSNIATITNFIVLNIAQSLVFRSFAGRPFDFWIYHYPVEIGGLAAFLAFLCSYAAAQTVNFVVQRKLVFNANNKLGGALVVYVLTILLVYLICVYVPVVVTPFLSPLLGKELAANVANILNIFIQVVIIYPVLKFVVMKKVEAKAGARG